MTDVSSDSYFTGWLTALILSFPLSLCMQQFAQRNAFSLSFCHVQLVTVSLFMSLPPDATDLTTALMDHTVTMVAITVTEDTTDGLKHKK